MTAKNKKIFCKFVGILFLLLFTSCTTKYGGINGTGIELSIGYILCNSILGCVGLFINSMFIFGVVAKKSNSLLTILLIIPIFLFILPFIYSPFPNGKFNLFWLKSITSSFIICVLAFVYSYISCEKINSFEIFIFTTVISTIEIIGLVYNDKDFFYKNNMWVFCHLAVLYTSICSFIFGNNISGRSKSISGAFRNIFGAILSIVYGGIGIVPLILDIPKNIWAYLLLGGFIGSVLFYSIFSGVTATKYNLYLEQEKKKKDFFDKLKAKRKEIKKNITYKRNCPEYDKTMDLINNAKSIEEVEKIYKDWNIYEKSHCFCSICKTEHSKTDKFCNYCEVSLEHPYPICPDCGSIIDYTKNILCSKCGFDWSTFLEKELEKKDFYKVVDIYNDIIKPENISIYVDCDLYEGKYICDGYRFPFSRPTAKQDQNNAFVVVYHPTVPQQGVIHVAKKKSDNKYPYFVYSAKLFNETHRIFEKKQKMEEMAHLRKIEEEKELARRQEDEKIKKEQEQKEAHRQYMKEISEQTGIILD